jgi:peroxiredoxin
VSVPESNAQTDKLKVGDTAPAFRLTAANREQAISLEGCLRWGPLVIEFLRGTW